MSDPFDELPSQPYSLYPKIELGKQLYPETAAWGMGVREVLPYATFVLEAWPELVINDYYAVRIHDLEKPKAWDTVKDVRDRYNLIVAGEKMPEGEVKIFGRVVRAASEQEMRSVTETILVKTTLPGGIDRRVWEPWHSELSMSIEGLPEGSVIDADVAASGVTCLIKPYLNIRKNDEITVVVDGIEVIHIVSPGEAANAKAPIRVFIDPEVFDKVNKFGPLGVVFKVRDVVNNISGGKYPFSKPYMLQSELDPELLSFPLFLVDGEAVSQVDLDTQSQSKLQVQVTLPLQRPTPNPKNKVIIVLTITQADGSTKIERLPAVTDRNLRGETVIVKNELLTPLTGGRFRVSFELLTNAGVLLKQSGSSLVSVVGTPVMMPLVTVSPIEAGLITVNTDLTVQIPNYAPHDPSWLETLVIEQSQAVGGGAIERYTQAQPAGLQGGTRRVTVDILKRFEGKGPVRIYYTVNDGKAAPTSNRESLKLEAEVGTRIAALPEPIVHGAVGSNIDPEQVKGPDVLISFPYTGTRSGDVLYWNVIGKGLAGSADGSITINAGTAGDVLPSITFPVGRHVLDLNVDADISISYSVERPGPTPVVFRSKVLTLSVGKVVVLGVPKVIEASQLQDQIDPKAVFNGATVEVAFKSMRADDQIFVHWRGAYGVSSIDVQVAGNPATNKVYATIPTEIIAKGIRNNGNKISVGYSFTRGAFTYHSVTIELDLLPLTGLPTPTVDNFNLSILPIYSLTDAARIRVPKWDFIDEHQYMWMTCQGTLADGSVFDQTIYDADLVTADGATNGVSPPAPVEQLRQLKNGSHLTIGFYVSFAQKADKETSVLFGTRDYVVHTVPATLAAPSFGGKPGAQLSIYPLDYEQNAFVTVAYTGMATAQKITLEWIFPDSTLAVIAEQYGVAAGKVNFAISAKILAASVGKTITLRYKVTSGTKTIQSEAQALTVQTIRAADLPNATINGLADGATLDLESFNGDATLTLPKWRLSAVGQLVTIDLRSDGAVPLRLLNAFPITEKEVTSGLVNIPVLRDWLLALGADSKVVVNCSVAFDGKYGQPQRVVFPDTSYSISNIPTLIRDLSPFDNYSFNGWSPGPAADAQDFRFILNDGVVGLYNNTFTMSSAGVVLKKSFKNLKVGTKYSFSVQLMRWLGAYDPPILSLATNQGILTNPVYVTNLPPHFITIRGDFYAISQRMDCMLVSHQPSGLGNDYRIANFQVVRV